MAEERVLVCDDGKESRDFIIEYILQPNKFDYLVARNGLECIEIAREQRPDLILLDLQMPKMNGIQVLDALKEGHLEIPVILMTFHGSEEIAIEVYRKGVHDYVKKPFTVDEMMWAIERTLGEVRLRKEKEALTERLIGANAEMTQRIRELNTLYNIGKTVTSLAGIDDVIGRIVWAATEITDSDAGSLYLIVGEQLVCRAIKYPNDPQIRTVNQLANDPFAWRSIQMGKPLALNAEELEPYRQKKPNIPAAILVVPLMLGERAIGALSVNSISPEARPFRKQDGAMLSALGDYAAIAIENATNFTELARYRDRELTKLRSTLGQFIIPALLEQILERDLPTLSSSRSEVGVMLLTLRGYDGLANRLTPDEFVTVMNRYLEGAVSIITRQGGVAERYLGDGIVAYFNVPESQANYLLTALETALAIIKTADGEPEGLNFSIGVHAGRAIVGNIGAVRGLGYAAVGDIIQVVQRLQEKAQSRQILVTEDLIANLDKDKVNATYLGQITGLERQQRLNVYEIIGLL